MIPSSQPGPEPSSGASDPLWEEIASLVEEAAGLPVGERREFVRANASNDWVRSEVMELLAAEAADDGSFDRGVLPQLPGDPLLGRRAGNCVLLRVAGEGGMGTVYEGRRTLQLGDGETTEQRVAVKVWHAGIRHGQEAMREASLLARLEHPHIARLLDTGQLADGRPYLVMEFVEGKPLLEGAAGLGLEAKLRLFGKICDAVESAHRALIVHRDLKPSNILLLGGGEPKLIDFGIGKSMADESETVDMRLTPRYASPEQVRREPLATSTDVYSLGVILYELVSGRHPYAGLSGVALTRAICEEAVGVPACPAELASVVLKAMAKRPGDRYGSAQALSDDVERFLQGEPVRAVEATAGYRARKFVWRHRWRLAAGTAALALIGFGFGRAYLEARVAAQRFEELRGLSRALLFEIHDEVAKTPGTLESRRVIVSKALEYLDRLAQSSRLDEQLQMDLAESYARVGEVQGSLTTQSESFGQHREAAKSYAKSVAIWEELYRANPRDRKRRGALARTVDKLSVACLAVGDERCQKERAKQSVALFRADAEENPEDPRAQMRWLTARIEATQAGQSEGEYLAARKEYREVAGGFDRLLAKYPEEKALREWAAYAYKRLGAVEGKTGEHEAGLALYEKALRLHEREGNRMGASTCYVDIAWIEQERKNWKAALAALDRALEIRRAEGENRGADENFKTALLSAEARKARLLVLAGRVAEGKALADGALRARSAELAGAGVNQRQRLILMDLLEIRAAEGDYPLYLQLAEKAGIKNPPGKGFGREQGRGGARLSP